MYPRYLELQAFGPYVKKQVIDFDIFQKNHLFLIRGETGSGKTMILDAITYALYGKSSGNQREDFESMRSRFAEDDEITYIDYQFLLHGHHYRFYRQVEIRTNRNHERVSKLRIDAGEIIEGVYYPFYEKIKLKNMEEKAIALIGLTHEQFVQVMILPQGKFEQLLVSKSEEKQEILKTLFQMDRWEKINNVLVDKVRDMRTRLDEKKQQMHAYLMSIGIADASEILEWLALARKEEKELNNLIDQQRKMNRLVRETVQKQQNIRVWLDEQAVAKKNWEKLLTKEAAIENLRVHIENQLRLQEVVSFFHTQQVLQEAFDNRIATAQSAQVEFKKAEDAFGKQNERELQRQRYGLRKEELSGYFTTLKNHQQIYEQYEENLIRSKRLEQSYQKSLQDLRNQQKVYTKEEVVYQEDMAQLNKLKEALSSRKAIEESYLKFEKAHYFYEKKGAAEKAFVKDSSYLEKTIQELLQHQQRLMDITKEHDSLYRQFLDHSAVQLAAQLEDQQPCPVCGSLHHPAVANGSSQYVDVMILRSLQQQVDKQKEIVLKQERIVQQQQVRQESANREIQQYEKEIIRLLGASFSQKYFIEIQKKYQEMLNKIQLYDKLQEDIEKNTLRLQQLQEIIKMKELDVREKEKNLTICQSELRTYQLQLFNDIPTLASLRKEELKVQQELQALNQSMQDIDKEIQQVQSNYEYRKQDALQSEKECKEAKKQLMEAQDILNKQCAARGIQQQDISQIIAKEELQQMQAEIHSYEISCTRVKTTLLDLEKRITQETILDLAQIEMQLQEAESREQLTSNKLSELQAQKKRYEKINEQIISLRKYIEEKEPVYLKMNQFVKSMRGDNGIGIERYVLGIMLSNITQHANQLLQHVHNGRYQIFRSDEASGRTRKFGLELSIYDAYTCSYRSVVSLSGGEKFLVSLALSLALSTVVQARNGGIHLDAMFIDEGFGTLDEHSIADALQVLQTIGSHKGVVGIISHVEVLKENIPAGIDVIKSRNGSFLRIRRD